MLQQTPQSTPLPCTTLFRSANKITDETKRKAAIQALSDNNELTTNRLFLGKQRDNSTLLVMSDVKGKPRIRLQVAPDGTRSEEHTSELQSRGHLVCRLLLEK